MTKVYHQTGLAKRVQFFAKKICLQLAFSSVKQCGLVVSEGPALAGREFFPFGCFEHRMVRWAGCTSSEEVANAGGASGTGKSPALKPEPRKWSYLPRNISTRMGVCRVGAVERTVVSPAGLDLFEK